MEHSLITKVISDKSYILLKFKGDLVSDKVEAFKEDLLAASETIQKYFKDSGKKIHILLDIVDFTGNYSLDALTSLVSFAKNNKLFVEKTATFGGSDKVKMAGKIAITLSNRDNIKMFDTKDEAEAWLSI